VPHGNGATCDAMGDATRDAMGDATSDAMGGVIRLST